MASQVWRLSERRPRCEYFQLTIFAGLLTEQIVARASRPRLEFLHLSRRGRHAREHGRDGRALEFLHFAETGEAHIVGPVSNRTLQFLYFQAGSGF
jgi:hypothetical protein